MPDPAEGVVPAATPERSAYKEGDHPRPEESARVPLGLTAERRRVLRVSVALFVFTFFAYWLLGPLNTPYDFQLSQANNIIHGHLDMTEEYTRNLNVLERVLYDGEGFCLPVDDPRGEQVAELIDNPRFSADCKHYMVHSFGPVLMLIPLVAIFGMNVSQTLISAILGAAAAVVIYAITRRFTADLRTQLALSVLALFGTTFWYSAADGGVWHFAQATAAFFVFAAIYATVTLRSPLIAAALIGAAFACRPTTILAFFFPVVALSDLWLAPSTGTAFWRRLRVRPLLELAVGIAPFVLLSMAVNFLRFGNPFEAGYSYIEEFHQRDLRWLWPPFSPSYIGRHVDVMFQYVPVVATTGSFVWPSWGGQALWLTSPALLLGLFAHLRRHRSLAQMAALALVLAGMLILLSGVGQRLGLTTWSVTELPLGLHLLPFWLVIGAAISFAVGLRDRLVVACWAAIIPVALVNWMFTGTGWAQFGYRFALDFIPFLWLLVVIAVPRVRRYHYVLIGASVLVNLWGVLWIFKFAPTQLFGWTWVGW